MKQIVAALTACVLLTGGIGVYAAAVESNENGLSIHGSGMHPGSEISVILINPNGDWMQVGTDKETNAVNFADVITVEMNGDYRTVIPMRSDCSAGLYRFMVGNTEETFWFAGANDRNRITEILINNIGDIKNLLKDKNLYFGILETESASYKKYYSLMDETMRDKLHTALQNYTYKGNTQTLEEKKVLFKDFDNYLQTACEKLFDEEGFTILKPYLTAKNTMQMIFEYNNIFEVDSKRVIQDDAVLAENIYDILKKENTLTNQELQNICYEQTVMRKINLLSLWNAGDLKDIFEKYPEVFRDEVQKSGFYSLTETKQNSVMQKVAGKNDYQTVEEVIKALNSAIKNPEETSKPKPGGNTGSGGKGSVGSVIIAPDKDNQNTPTPTPTPDDNEEMFDDIEDYSWAKESILYFAKKGVVSGVGERKFLPGNNVTREEFLKMAMRAFEIKEEAVEAVFSDVDMTQWYAPYVNTAKKKGLINGISDSEFGVGLPITREDAAVILVKAAEYAGIAIPTGSNTSEAFSDQAEIAEYAAQAVNKLFAAGVISGKGNMRFAPKENATRAEVSKMLYALIKKGA